MEVLRPVSCMCLKEIIEANGPRGKREVWPFWECFLRVPSLPVPTKELIAMQHSAFLPRTLTVTTSLSKPASTSSSPDPAQPVTYDRMFTWFREFDWRAFIKSCSVPDQPDNTAGAGFRMRVADGSESACKEFARPFSKDPRDRYGPENSWASDESCRERGPCRSQGVAAFVPSNGNANGVSVGAPPCCQPATGRCREPPPGSLAMPLCACTIGMAGGTCDLPCRMGCVNECKGRGECLAAWCKCQPGWFGIDCSIPGNRSNDPNFWRAGTPVGPTLPPPRSIDELKIYVYDVAPSVLQGEPCPFGCGGYCGDGIYKANIFFLSSLLKDSVHRTDNPNEAHLFLAPQLPYRYNSNGANVGPHMMDTVDAIFGMGYFARNGGKDHVWWAVSDIGPCEVPDLTRPGIILGHYGRLDNRAGRTYPCMDPKKDLVLPSMAPASRPQAETYDPLNVVYVQTGAWMQARSAHEGKGPMQPRTIFVFMAASNREMLTKACGEPEANAQICRDDEYAMGARMAIFNWFRAHTTPEMMDIMVLDHGIGGEYYARLLTAKFCLEALGHGFSTRIADYVTSGCIPVIVRDDVLWPYESFEMGGDTNQNWLQDDPLPGWGDLPRIRYQDFAVVFHKREVPNILATLRGISDERVRALQEGVRRVHRAFLWDQGYGWAYNYTIAGLARLRARMRL